MAKSRTITVVFWNILFDDRPNTRVPAQTERYGKFADTLLDLHQNLDVVCLTEVENSHTHGHLGEGIAALTKNKHGSWTHHHRDNEQIGMFGRAVGHVDFLPLSDNKTAAITRVGTTSVAGIHLTHRVPPPTRLQKGEIKLILDRLADDEQAVIMGDFNSMPWQPPRKFVESYGYQSVFKLLGQRQPVTGAIHDYRLFMNKWQRTVMKYSKGFAVDDIYVKGNITVKATGTFKGESDHYGVWATIIL